MEDLPGWGPGQVLVQGSLSQEPKTKAACGVSARVCLKAGRRKLSPPGLSSSKCAGTSQPRPATPSFLSWATGSIWSTESCRPRALPESSLAAWAVPCHRPGVLPPAPGSVAEPVVFSPGAGRGQRLPDCRPAGAFPSPGLSVDSRMGIAG